MAEALRTFAFRRARVTLGPVLEAEGFSLAVRRRRLRTWHRRSEASVAVLTLQSHQYPDYLSWDFCWGVLFPQAADLLEPLLLPAATRLEMARFCNLDEGFGFLRLPVREAKSEAEVLQLAADTLQLWEARGRSAVRRLSTPRAARAHLERWLKRPRLPRPWPEWQGFAESAALSLVLGEPRRGRETLEKMLLHHLEFEPRPRLSPAHWLWHALAVLGWAESQGLPVVWPQGFDDWLRRCWETDPRLAAALVHHVPDEELEPQHLEVPASWRALSANMHR